MIGNRSVGIVVAVVMFIVCTVLAAEEAVIIPRTCNELLNYRTGYITTMVIFGLKCCNPWNEL